MQLRARRSPKLVAVGVLAIVLGALGAAALYSAANDEAGAVTVTRHIPRGTEIAADDLAVVQVPAGFAVDTLHADDLDSLVGSTALTDLPAGSFPLSSHVGEDPLPEGQALVGFRMSHGQLPVSPMPSGTTIQLVDLSTTAPAPADQAPAESAPAPQPAAAPSSTAPMQAVVAVAPTMLDDGASFTLDVLVALEHAEQVAQLAAAGELALVVVKEP